jgi:large conductance mechanosensitive channel
MFKEFREFVNQGNALDLAIGVVIGAAFAKIVTSVVNDLVMPVLSIPLGKIQFVNMYMPLNNQPYGLPLEEAKKAGAVVAYGAFIQTCIEFPIIAFTIFLIVRQINKWRKPKAA